jgi:nucleoside-diphosphate-sugar epimerase
VPVSSAISKRTSHTPTRIAVTGASVAVAEAVLRAGQAATARYAVRLVLDADTSSSERAPTPAPGKGVRYTDLTSPDVVKHLAGADAVVHVAVSTDIASDAGRSPAQRRAAMVRTTETVATAAAAAGVSHLVVVTSARVYGALADNPVPLPEGGPLRASPNASTAGDLLAVEDVVERVRSTYPGMLVTVVRPAAIVGNGADTAVSRHFVPPRILLVRGTHPLWQFCHVDDLAQAVLVTVTARLEPVVTVAAPGYLTQEQVETIADTNHIEVPAGMAHTTAAQLFRAGVVSTPPEDLAYVQHPWVVSSERLIAAGWTAAHTNESCLTDLLATLAATRSTPLLRKETALGAASAAVAMVATAALLRRARRRGAR